MQKYINEYRALKMWVMRLSGKKSEAAWAWAKSFISPANKESFYFYLESI